jgi:hypothetical protein
MRKARLAEVKLPEFGVPDEMPELDAGIYTARLSRLRSAVAAAGLDALVIYADREHCANMAWLTGFDPRFEEAMLIVGASGDPVLLTGLENQGMGKAAPLALDVRLYPPFGLMGQDRSATLPLGDLLRDCGLRQGMSIGAAGWKYYGPQEASDPAGWLEIPSFIADTLRLVAGPSGSVRNAGALLMDAETGLRAVMEIDELARFEFAACHASEAVKRVVRGTKPGMREFEAARLMQPIGLPLSCHQMFSSGPRAWNGLPSPSSRVVGRGDAVTTAMGVVGALTCRNGWLVESAGELPEEIRDYPERLVFPYFEAVAEWLETVGIGVEGGDLYARLMKRIGDPFFGVKLNPGHLIHVDEWMNSPIAKGSRQRLRSGMALQVDIIPATGGPYFTINMEDGIALLDEAGRAQFAERYPAAWARISARRAFMADSLGIRLKPEVLPFSNLASHLPPFWLSPSLAVVLG